MHPDWVRSLCNQCQAAGVSFFFKQWGAWTAEPTKVITTPKGKRRFAKVWKDHNDTRPVWMARVGKKAAGRLLDGRTWDEMPR